MLWDMDNVKDDRLKLGACICGWRNENSEYLFGVNEMSICIFCDN